MCYYVTIEIGTRESILHFAGCFLFNIQEGGEPNGKGKICAVAGT